MDTQTKAMILVHRRELLRAHIEANGETAGAAAALAATEKELQALGQSLEQLPRGA